MLGYQLNLKKNIIQQISVVFTSVIGLFAALESFLMSGRIGTGTDRISYVAVGAVSALFIVYYALIGRIYKKIDAWIFLSLFVYAFIVTCVYYGFSLHLFAVRFYYIWLVCVFFFIATRVMDKPDDLLRAFSFAYVLTVCIAGIFILVHASLTLQEAIPGSDRYLGCFRVGRLCGMANANTMAFYCLTGIMLSIYRCISGDKKARIFYGIAIFILWFLMGLNNSRTTNYALAFTIAAFLFVFTRKQFTKLRKSAFVKYASSFAISIAAAFTVIALLMVPTLLYRTGTKLAAKISHDQQLMDNVSLIYERDVADIETLEDRNLIWNRSVELIFKNPRRTLFGISVRSPERVYGAYEGRHDIPMPFAHTMFLEVFRRLGLIGLMIWIVLLCIWGKNAIQKLFKADQDNRSIYLMSAAAGVLLTGITELGPFVFSTAMGVPYLFFICCGMAMRDDEYEKMDIA